MSCQISIFCRTWYRLSALQVSILQNVWIKFYGGGWKPPTMRLKTPVLIELSIAPLALPLAWGSEASLLVNTTWWCEPQTALQKLLPDSDVTNCLDWDSVCKEILWTTCYWMWNVISKRMRKDRLFWMTCISTYWNCVQLKFRKLFHIEFQVLRQLPCKQSQYFLTFLPLRCFFCWSISLKSTSSAWVWLFFCWACAKFWWQLKNIFTNQVDSWLAIKNLRLKINGMERLLVTFVWKIYIMERTIKRFSKIGSRATRE